jgi:hypothetical protein
MSACIESPSMNELSGRPPTLHLTVSTPSAHRASSHVATFAVCDERLGSLALLSAAAGSMMGPERALQTSVRAPPGLRRLACSARERSAASLGCRFPALTSPCAAPSPLPLYAWPQTVGLVQWRVGPGWIMSVLRRYRSA